MSVRGRRDRPRSGGAGSDSASPVAIPLDRRSLGGIAALALVVRVAYVAVFMRGYVPNSDADSYFAIGRAVSKGQGYVFTLPFEFVHATAIRPPLYPTVIAAAFRIFGVHVGVAQGVNVIAGSGAAVLGALIAARIGGSRAGLCAGIVLALYPPLIANDVTVLVESLAVVLLFATVLFLLDGRTVLAGVSLGLLMLDRASAQWFVVVLAIWVLWRFGWRHAVRMVVIVVLVVSPWVVRNAVQVGGPVLVATNGFNLNATYSNEAREADGFVDAYFDSRFAEMRVDATDEVALDAQLRAKALRDLRAHPSEVFRVARHNVEQWLELEPGRNREPERLDGRNLGVRDWTLPLFYLVTIAGLFALVRARRSAAAQLLGLAAAYFTAVSLATIAVPRLRSVFDACVAVGAGVALAWLLDRKADVSDAAPKARPLRGLRSAGILALAAVVVAATGLAWQARTHTRARRAVGAAVARDASALDALDAQYRASRSANEPPQLAKVDLDRVRDLMTVLGDRAPQVASAVRPRVADALRAVRVASHEADVVGLLSAGEYLAAAAKHRTPSVEAVRTRYERQIRSSDPTLEPWDSVTAGRSLLRSESAVDALRAG